MTESPRIMTRSGSAGDGAGASRIGSWPAYPPAPGTPWPEPDEARCDVRTTLAGSATAGMVATTITTAVTTPASGAPQIRAPPRSRARRTGRSTR